MYQFQEVLNHCAMDDAMNGWIDHSLHSDSLFSSFLFVFMPSQMVIIVVIIAHIYLLYLIYTSFCLDPHYTNYITIAVNLPFHEPAKSKMILVETNVCVSLIDYQTYG